MMKVEKHKISIHDEHYPLFLNFSRLSNSLYNHASFVIRKNFINNKTKDNKRKYMNYNAMDKLFKKIDEKNYRGLPSQTSQQVLMLLDRNWKSFFKSMKSWKNNKSSFTGCPKLPKGRKPGGLFLLIFTNQQCKLKDGVIHFPKVCEGFTIKPHNDLKKINQVRIIPAFKSFTVEIVYDDGIKEVEYKKDNGRYIGIDLGLDNLVAISSNCSQSMVINGKGLKSKNKYFNYRISKLKSELDKCQKEQYTSHKINQLWTKRKNIMNDYFHKTSRAIVNYCLENKISKVVIGHNRNQKQDLKMKNFTQIPIFSLIPMLKYKLDEEGIELIETEENYTSGTSFLDNEEPIKENYDKSRRINRGLFKSNDGRLINSDINGAFQIMKKVYRDVKLPTDNGFVFNPNQLIIG